jgi:hypothetical protein
MERDHQDDLDADGKMKGVGWIHLAQDRDQ